MVDFVSRVTETVLKTEESALRFNSIFTNCVESVARVTKKALTLGVGAEDGESSLTYETVADLAMREIEKRKSFFLISSTSACDRSFRKINETRRIRSTTSSKR